MNVRKMLKSHGLRVTDCRMRVLAEFLHYKHALSHTKIESIVQDSFDRVTIYRTLNSFVENGLIHQVPDIEGGTKYALCQAECSAHQHDDGHVHFKCLKCGELTCIEHVAIPKVSLPEGFQNKESSLLVSGTCPSCH